MGAVCLCQPRPAPSAGELRLESPGRAATLLTRQPAAAKPPGPPAGLEGSADAAVGTAGEAEALQFARRASQVDCSKPRLLLVSDNLPCSELLLAAAKASTVAVHVRYAEWGLGELRAAIVQCTGEPQGQFQTVGILDHGSPGEFCLLQSVCGGALDQEKVQRSEEVQRFLRFLAGFVAPGDPARWRERLDARIDLMNCSVYVGKGEDFVGYLEDLTRVNWAASSNQTGFGSDWVMESDAGLGDVAACYFQEPELLKWRFTAKAPKGQGNALEFKHGVVGGEDVDCVVSFPGMFEEDWNEMLASVVLSKALLKKLKKKEDGRPLFSTACVFLPKAAKHFGHHWSLEEAREDEKREEPSYKGPCYCSLLYPKQDSEPEEKPDWGCYWFEKWRAQLELAVQRKQRLVVVYKKGETGQGDQATWGDLGAYDSAAKGLGGSQRGEVAYLRSRGWGSFTKVDVEENHKNLKKRMLYDMEELCDGHTGKVAEAIQENEEVKRGLRTLCLKHMALGKQKDLDKLCDAVKECSALRDFSLVSSGLEESGVGRLAEALPDAKHLRSLDLQDNPLCDAGVAQLSLLLPRLPKLSTLNISLASVGDVGAAGLAAALPGCKSLKRLVLSGNEVGDVGAAALAEAFKECPALEKVCIDENPVGAAGRKAMKSSKRGLKVE